MPLVCLVAVSDVVVYALVTGDCTPYNKHSEVILKLQTSFHSFC